MGKGVPENQKKAIKWYKIISECNDDKAISAANNVGNIYALQDKDKKAVKWYQKSADRGFAAAQFNLAVHYMHGLGIAEDKHKALELLQKSADQHDLKALSKLAKSYAKGTIVERDETKAVELF